MYAFFFSIKKEGYILNIHFESLTEITQTHVLFRCSCSYGLMSLELSKTPCVAYCYKILKSLLHFPQQTQGASPSQVYAARTEAQKRRQAIRIFLSSLWFDETFCFRPVLLWWLHVLWSSIRPEKKHVDVLSNTICVVSYGTREHFVKNLIYRGLWYIRDLRLEIYTCTCIELSNKLLFYDFVLLFSGLTK